MYTFDYCCRAEKSTYRVVVNRAISPQGPYLDKQGRPALDGGGSELLVTVWPIIGPGGAFYFEDNGQEYIVYHYYDGKNNGYPRLAINNLGWTDDGWPFVY